MKRILPLIISHFIFCCTYGQSLSPEVRASAGDCFIGANAILSWTLGESVSETVMDGNVILTQGFQQGHYNVIPVPEVPGKNLTISVYPNPTPDNIYVSIAGNIKKTYTIEISDVFGKKLLSDVMHEEIKKIELNQFPVNVYILNIHTENRLICSFKILKVY